MRAREQGLLVGNPITYLLEDLSKEAVLGSFYKEELQHVD